MEHQSRFCLSPEFSACPRYQKAEERVQALIVALGHSARAEALKRESDRPPLKVIGAFAAGVVVALLLGAGLVNALFPGSGGAGPVSDLVAPGRQDTPQGQVLGVATARSLAPASSTAVILSGAPTPNPTTKSPQPTATPTPGAPRTAVVTNTRGLGLRIRANPDTSSPIVGGAKEGETVQVLESGVAKDGSLWYKVRLGSVTGWASSQFLQIR